MKNRLIRGLIYLIIFGLGLMTGLGAVLLEKQVGWPPQWDKLTNQDGEVSQPNTESTAIFEEINPPAGYQLPVSFGQLGPEMLKSGVVDFEKFKSTYDKSGSPLTAEQIKIMQTGSDTKITINPDNSYFLLNFFWAVGLANKSKILTEGEMVKYGGIKEAGNFASTGGWSLSDRQAMNYYAKQKLIALTPEQEALVAQVAAEMYRPCCNNSTAFPDCNHGMALLGLLQLMAAAGADENQMFEAAKYVNSYWFPSNYYDLALYFKNKEGLSFAQIDAKRIMSKEFSSASGAAATKQWLATQGLVAEPPKKSGGCGV